MMRLFELLAMGGSPAGTDPNPTGQMLSMVGTLVVCVVMFYFLLLRPQQKQRKEQEELLKAVKTGDKILLNSGIFGIVSNVKEKVKWTQAEIDAAKREGRHDLENEDDKG